jgi:ribosomal protein S18 acetylase RimI-like enzyme
MHPAPRRPLPGIVFRRLRSPSERSAARRLLVGSGVPPAAIRSAGDTVLYGLWDLATATGEELVGVAATRLPDDAGSVELCGIAIRADLRRRGLGLRLVSEAADAWRAKGAARLVARLADDQQPAAALLARAGFATTTDADGQSAGTDLGWGYLAL